MTALPNIRQIEFDQRPGGPPGAGRLWMSDTQLVAAAERIVDASQSVRTLQANYATGESELTLDVWHVAQAYLKMVTEDKEARELIQRGAHLLEDRVGKLKMHPSIQLASGAYFDFLEPWKTPISIEDIAAGLSRVCRFTGQLALSPEEVYVVAQHVVLASENCEPGFELDALMHDASESVANDMASPLKQLLPCYKQVEERIEENFAGLFGLIFPMPPQVKAIDLVMLATEKRDIMPKVDNDEKWGLLENVTPLPFTIRPWSHAEAYWRFLHRFHYLTTGELPAEGAPFAAPHEHAPAAYIRAYNAARGFTPEQASAKEDHRAQQRSDYQRRQIEQQQHQHDQVPFR